MLVIRCLPSGAEYLQTDAGLTHIDDDAIVQKYKAVLPFIDDLTDSWAANFPGHLA